MSQISRLLRLEIFVLLVFTSFTTNAQYCTPSAIGSHNTNYISNVAFGGANNSSSGVTGDYVDYSSVVFEGATAGQNYDGLVSVTLNGWNQNTNSVIVWLNFNENGDDDLDDAGEQFIFTFEDNNNTGGSKTIDVPISIPIPADAHSGIARMRIGYRIGTNYNNLTACNFKNKAGEVEDYSVEISNNANNIPDDDPVFCTPTNIGSYNVYQISNVSIKSLNNSSNQPTGDYTFYDDITYMEVLEEEVIEGVVSVDLNGWNTSTHTLAVWMNFNENSDDDFNDTGERFLFPFQDNNNTGGIKTVDVPISIAVPATENTGSSVLRIGVISGTDTNFSACDLNYRAGEIEDYRISYSVAADPETNDNDGDSIVDSEDLDDDNDGILDSIECTDLGKLPLLNPDFEDLDITQGLDGGPTDVVPTSGIWKGDASNVPHWLSSDATNNHLEIWHNSQTAGNDAGGVAFSGTQWAEVNATTNDGLYQDIVTEPGDILKWSFAHRKRTGFAASAQEDIVRLLIGDPNGTLISQGDFSSAGDASWTEHSGTYVVPAGQTTTRLTFTAIAVASGSSSTSSGNFVDKVQLYILPNCKDTDSDGTPDYLDIDSDNDGIPDNVEAQPTAGYIVPSGNGASMIDANLDGIDDNFGSGFLNLQDTDSDGIFDYLDSDSDNDGLTDIKENGMADTFTAADVDNDGLNNAFETNGVNDPNLDVNEDIENPSDLSILPDSDGDLSLGGDLDYRDGIEVYIESASIDFDGTDDYLSTSSFIDGLSEVTIMAWVNSDSGNTSDMSIAGEDSGCKLWLKNGNKPSFTIKTVGNAEETVDFGTINQNQWHHITGSYNSNSGLIKLYIDGEFVASKSISGSASIQNTADSNGNFEVGRLSTNGVPNNQYFKGAIDEVRVFDLALTDEQIQQMIYQEIEDNFGSIKGSVIPKNIWDISSGNTVLWSNLIAYYPMTNILTSRTNDESVNNHSLTIHNITTVQEQTAPMPYVTSLDGDWTSENTWLHGDVWDITNVDFNKDWSIVKIQNNIETNNSHAQMGMIIDTNKTLSVLGDNEIRNNYYLELNGTLNLEDDSQLIQSENSDLVTSSEGKILRRQEGSSSFYWYNYWASPVGSLGVTSLSDNNAISNNTNNSTFNVSMLKKPTGISFEFTGALQALGKISTYWLYTYQNGVTYYDYASLSPSTPIQPGIGYTQKGTGVSGDYQQYIFEGKPNNGTILVNVTDVGGSGSVPAESKTDFLLGNPYPSALDIHKFIDDNEGVIDGTIQLWQQWSGSSHYLNDYNGGYAQVNKLGSVRAYQFEGIEGGTTGSQDGTKVPTRYLPVGQGFVTEIVSSGSVEFNNSQRVFVKESDANGSYVEGSVFFINTAGTESTSASESEASNSESLMQKIRLVFKSVNGPDTNRELLLGFSNFTSDAYDYGYDSENSGLGSDDLSSLLNNKPMLLQAYSEITPDKEIPLMLKTSGNYNYSIELTETENIPEDQPIYIKDNLSNTYFDLTNELPYEFSSEAGEFANRFKIVFQSQDQTLSQIEEEINEMKLYYASSRNKIVVLNPNQKEIESIEIYNVLGQSVYLNDKIYNGGSYAEYPIQDFSTGTYIVQLKLNNNVTLSKKIIVN